MTTGFLVPVVAGLVAGVLTDAGLRKMYAVFESGYDLAIAQRDIPPCSLAMQVFWQHVCDFGFNYI